MTKPSTDGVYPSPARGQAWKERTGQVKPLLYILAVADGYVMCRYKGCMVWCMSIKTLHSKYSRMTDFDRKMGRPS